jgi:hypothetical protein
MHSTYAIAAVRIELGLASTLASPRTGDVTA